MLTWDPPGERYYQYGLDRAVLYRKNVPPVAWNGLTGFDEGDAAQSSILFRDGVVFMADMDASDFSGGLTAIAYPDEFSPCIGIVEATDGLFVDNQKPKPFSVAYRTLVGSGQTGDMFGYQIHLVYNAMASIAPRARKSQSSGSDLIEFSFALVCTPVRLPGFRPSAHYVIDTRNMSESKVKQLEDILYGTETVQGRMPLPLELYDIMNFGDAVKFTVHTDGTYTVEASHEKLYSTASGVFVMKGVNGVANPDGTYLISDGGDTDVIIET